MTIRSLEKLKNGTEITILNKSTGERIRSILVDESTYIANKKIFNNVRNPIKDDIYDLHYIVNTTNGKCYKYIESSILLDCITDRTFYEIVKINKHKLVKIYPKDIIIFHKYNSPVKIEKIFVKVYTSRLGYHNELSVTDCGLSAILRTNPYINKFFVWDNTLYFIEDIKQTTWSKIKNWFNFFK